MFLRNWEGLRLRLKGWRRKWNSWQHHQDISHYLTDFVKYKLNTSRENFQFCNTCFNYMRRWWWWYKFWCGWWVHPIKVYFINQRNTMESEPWFNNLLSCNILINKMNLSFFSFPLFNPCNFLLKFSYLNFQIAAVSKIIHLASGKICVISLLKG